jgi:hypothetical protein
VVPAKLAHTPFQNPLECPIIYSSTQSPMKKFLATLDWSDGTCNQVYLESCKSAGRIMDDFLTKDRTGELIGVDVRPVIKSL